MDDGGQVLEALLKHLCELRVFVAIVGDKERNYYVQAAGIDEGDAMFLRCEAVSNEFLTEPNRIDLDGVRLLRELGWEHPDPNWWMRVQIRSLEDVISISDVLLRTLTDVFGFEGGELRTEFGDIGTTADKLDSPVVRDLVAQLCRARAAGDHDRLP